MKDFFFWIKIQNEELQNRVEHLQEIIRIERERKRRESNESNIEIERLRTRLHQLDDDYQNLTVTKSSLDSELFIYRTLLDRAEKKTDQSKLLKNDLTRRSSSILMIDSGKI